MASSSTSRRSRPCSSLPADILIEIFTYLPLASIYRFKSVTKVWLSILSNPNFLTKWLQFNKYSLPRIHYQTITPHLYDANPLKFKSAYPGMHSQFISRNEHGFSFEFLFEEEPFEEDEFYLLGSSNGLVLCHSVGSDQEGQHHVCNPLTQKWVSIPSPPDYEASQYDISAIVCESPLSASCSFKVVLIPYFDEPSKKFNVDMFCSDLGEWESFEVSCEENVQWDHRSDDENVVTVNGVLYWIVGRNRMLVYNLNQNGSDGHRCSLIKLPDEEFEFLDFETHNIGESEGCVCYARTLYCISTGRITLSVWVLKEANWQILQKDISLDDILEEVCVRTDGDLGIEVLGFSPVDCDVVLLGYEHLVWEFDVQTRNFYELSYPSPPSNRCFSNADRMSKPFVLKPMPTVLPSCFDKYDEE